MHVGLNCVFLVPGETGGMEVYAWELMRALRGVRVTAFVNREAAGEDLPEGVERVVVPVRASNRVEWVRGEQVLLPRLAARAGVDLVHSLASTAPATGRFKRVVTIHDLNYRMVPDAHFGLRGLGMRALVPLAARRSHRVIADSESTKRDLVAHAGVAAAKVDVVPLGLGQPARVAPLPEADVRARFDLGERPVVLTLSAKRPHKNLALLLRALAERPEVVAVLPGYATPHEAELRALAADLGIGDRVRFPGWVGAEELEGLFAVATAFAYPSRYEGFGLPVLEAMARGVPVVCSNAASLPEVAGDAALLVTPDDAPGFATALGRLLDDPDLRDRLATAGRARAAEFTWERTAEATRAVYERVLRA
jgi:glycosyltransferase involved in cell wall biosynthesis